VVVGINTSCCSKRAVEGLCWAKKIGMLVDKKRIKINERTLYARPPSLVLKDAVGVVSGKRLPSLRTTGGRQKGGENSSSRPDMCCSS
jgi:hypothetical protein